MHILINNTGETKELRLCAIGGNENIAGEFMKNHIVEILGTTAPLNKELAVLESKSMTQNAFNEWQAILAVAQEILLMRHNYIQIPCNSIHGLIERDVKTAYQNQINYRRDKLFGLKNALDAELAIFKRLTQGVVSVKSPAKITQIRHTSSGAADHWLMQVYGDFVMTMPVMEDSFDFKASIELEFNKYKNDDLTAIDDDEWLFPFSMSDVQEEIVLNALHGAAQKHFIDLGITDGTPMNSYHVSNVTEQRAANDTNTVDPNINISFIDIDDITFSVRFDQTIGGLPAGKDVYLQLPHNADSEHDDRYDDETIDACLAVIGSQYSDMDLSIMKIIGSDDMSASEIKAVAPSARFINDAGALIERPLSFYILKNNEDFHAIEEDQVHKYYTQNKCWRRAFEMSDLFNEESLKELYDGGY